MTTMDIKKDPANPQPTEVMEKAIVDIAAGTRKLLAGRLNRRGILVLLKAASGVDKNIIEKVLDGMATLDKKFLKAALVLVAVTGMSACAGAPPKKVARCNEAPQWWINNAAGAARARGGRRAGQAHEEGGKEMRPRDEAAMCRSDAARVIEVIQTTLTRRGDGKEDSPVRIITQFWGKDGTLLAERDDWDGRGQLIGKQTARIKLLEETVSRLSKASTLEFGYQVIGTCRQRVVKDVVEERQRQLTGEGFDVHHDAKYTKNELVRAAVCYALPAAMRVNAKFWPWAKKWWKPKDRRRDLVRAAALLIAELERMDRAQPDNLKL